VPASGRSDRGEASEGRPSAPRRARVALLRIAYRIAYRLLSIYSLLRRKRGRGRGVKCVLVHGDSVVLVRHTYGPRRLWHVPGGGLHRGESTIAAAHREMREELGVDGVTYHLLAEVDLRLAHRNVRIGCVHAELADTVLHPDPVEIAEARFFARDALPAPLGKEVRDLVSRAFATAATSTRTTVGQ